MAAFNITPSIGIDFTVAYTVSTSTPEYPGSPIALGTIVDGVGGAVWILCKLEAASTCTAGDALLVTTPSTWEVKALTSTLGKGKLGQRVGIAGATGTAGQYVWMQVAGYIASLNVATGSTANTVLHSSGTAGRLTTTAVGGTSAIVSGGAILATAASNVATASLTGLVVGADD